MTGCPIASAYHAPAKNKRAANTGAHRNGDHIPAATTCPKPHFAGQNRIHVVITRDRTYKPFAETPGERKPFKELQFAPEPDNLSRCDINPARKPDSSPRYRGRSGLRQALNLDRNII
jgi:hypothetical protein